MKNLLQKITFTLMLVFVATINSSLSAQKRYEVYDGAEFSIMFTVNNDIADDVKFASRGDSEWTGFDVYNSHNWEGKGKNKNCIFTFYVRDGKSNRYQIDYYEDNYVMVFQMDANQKAIGSGWKLKLRE